MTQPYGKGSRSGGGDVLSRDQVLEAMAYLGYETRDERHELYDDAYKTAAALAGKVKENIMLPVLIAQEYAKHHVKVPGVRHNRSGEFTPTVNGVDLPVTTFDQERAQRLADDACSSKD